MRKLLSLVAGLSLSACVSNPAPVLTVTRYSGDVDLTVGVVADTQIQNREAWAARNMFRNKRADVIITPVTIRPPALDVAARALLRAHLAAQQRRGVAAIFYLGDGSNHGCRSELSRETVGDEGIFPILRLFRQQSRIAVFFILGNHDFLAAGNSEEPVAHAALCGGRDNVATKGEVIALADTFNRESTGAGWAYRSSITTDLKNYCEGPSQAEWRQSRRRGCYYAATLDVERAGRRFRFLLLDTNDYAGVTRSRLLRGGGTGLLETDFEGTRGAMSFDREDPIVSQTSWLARRGEESLAAGGPPDVLIALTHYDVVSLRKTLLAPLSKQSQRFGDIFTGAVGENRNFYRDRAFVVSAHTHSDVTTTSSIGITEGGTEVVRPEEVNIGSTTDYPSLSAVLRIGRGANGTLLSHEPLTPSREACGAVLNALDDMTFTRAVLRQTKGRAAVALDRNRPFNYQNIFAQHDVDNVFANIDQFIRGSDERAICLGLEAAAMEAGEKIDAPTL